MELIPRPECNNIALWWRKAVTASAVVCTALVVSCGAPQNDEPPSSRLVDGCEVWGDKFYQDFIKPDFRAEITNRRSTCRFDSPPVDPTTGALGITQVTVNFDYRLEGCTARVEQQFGLDRIKAPTIYEVNGQPIQYNSDRYSVPPGIIGEKLLVAIARHGQGPGVEELKRCAPHLYNSAKETPAA